MRSLGVPLCRGLFHVCIAMVIFLLAAVGGFAQTTTQGSRIHRPHLAGSESQV
jgi:hypothetical protein